jgi:hypothetical protein
VSTWTSDELDRIGDADELQITSARTDGTLRPYVPIWVVRVGGDLYVRSYRGPEGRWFQHVQQRHEGRIRAGGVDRDVTVADATTDGVEAAVDEAYHTKYGRYGDAYVRPMTAPAARATTLRLVPKENRPSDRSS